MVVRPSNLLHQERGRRGTVTGASWLFAISNSLAVHLY